MATKKESYSARLDIDYPKKLDRFTTLVRAIWAIPIFIIFSIISGGGSGTANAGGIAGAFFVATALMILFRQKYPRWWFDFALEFNRFSTRVCAYLFLLTDRYPSTDENQSVHLDIDYPDAKKDLNNWLPLVKWFLAIPHYVVLSVLLIGAMFATIFAWFAILFTGTYPKSLFDYVVGVARWGVRVTAYAFLLTTDKYPPFSLK